ncbi:uncharacterized protein LOC111086032 isoform X2 [Limulus polyphemus]|uniref:Uncharacterized protein LOC111086032 isoform X2 n=1 Tax=Limulus polyphemus TaxID=6850 RepID=A0ABM1SHD9_LIMPO|nr:uncharacterized protein LOC111086032 isoform X2 [Limulus polyphemus]
MKVLVCLVLVVCVGVAEVSILHCDLDPNQLEKYAVCMRERLSNTFLERLAECMKKYYPDMTDAGMLADACTPSKDAVHMELCMRPVLRC